MEIREVYAGNWEADKAAEEIERTLKAIKPEENVGAVAFRDLKFDTLSALSKIFSSGPWQAGRPSDDSSRVVNLEPHVESIFCLYNGDLEADGSRQTIVASQQEIFEAVQAALPEMLTLMKSSNLEEHKEILAEAPFVVSHEEAVSKIEGFLKPNTDTPFEPKDMEFVIKGLEHLIDLDPLFDDAYQKLVMNAFGNLTRVSHTAKGLIVFSGWAWHAKPVEAIGSDDSAMQKAFLRKDLEWNTGWVA